MVMDILISLDDFYSMLRMLFTSDILCLILLRILDSLYHLIDCTSARSLLVLMLIDLFCSSLWYVPQTVLWITVPGKAIAIYSYKKCPGTGGSWTLTRWLEILHFGDVPLCNELFAPFQHQITIRASCGSKNINTGLISMLEGLGLSFDTWGACITTLHKTF